MASTTLQEYPLRIFLFGQPSLSQARCINFIEELRGSLSLFGVGALADYFPNLAAGTTALFVLLVFLKAFSKPKRLLAVMSLPLVYLTTLRVAQHAVREYLSYCF